MLHSVADRVPRDFIMRSRQYDDDEWRSCTGRLPARGMLDDAGALTDAGIATQTEHRGHHRSVWRWRAFDALDDDELETLFRTLTPITRAVIAGGDIPASTPMGLRRDDLDDDGAHLD